MRALGLYTAVSIGGSAVGLVAGGMLTQWVHGGGCCSSTVPIGVAVLLVGRAVLPETQRHRGRFDLGGSIYLDARMVRWFTASFVRRPTAGVMPSR